MITVTRLPSGASLRWDHANREGVLTVAGRPDTPTRSVHTTEAAVCVGEYLAVGCVFPGPRTTQIPVWSTDT